MAQKQSEDQKRIEELNNRVFLLEDRVDTSRVAMESSGTVPRLPVIRLRPAPQADDEGRSDEGRSDEGRSDEGRSDEGRSDEGRSDETAGADEGGSDTSDDDPQETPRSSLVEKKRVVFSGAARAEGGARPVLRLYGESTRPGSDVAAPLPGPLPGPDPAAVQEKLPVVPLPPRRVARQASASVQPMRDYQSALNMYRSGKVSAAADAFDGFLKRYTRHEYADNALYWLGECFYDMKNYRLALKMFRRVVEEFPAGNKAPDALLKMGLSYLRLKEKGNARTVLAQLVESFPKSQVARLASETLVKIQ